MQLNRLTLGLLAVSRPAKAFFICSALRFFSKRTRVRAILRDI